MYKNLILTLSVLLLCLVLSEVYFRIEGRYATYAEKVGTGGYVSPYTGTDSWYIRIAAHHRNFFKRPEFEVSWTANNEGVKDSDFVVTKSKIRIIALGDSYTEGVGAVNDSSFPRQLSRLLADSSHHSAEVWNCGVSSSDPVYQFRLFKDKFLRYKPDIAIVVINTSDIHDVIYRGGFERFCPDGTVRYRRGPWFESAYAYSFLVRRFVHDVLHYDWQFIPPADVAKTNADAIRILTGTIDSFSTVCAEQHIGLLFVFHPFRTEFDEAAEYNMAPLIHYCETAKLNFVDVRKDMQEKGWNATNIGALYWPVDGHCKNKGYHCFAEAAWRETAGLIDQ